MSASNTSPYTVYLVNGGFTAELADSFNHLTLAMIHADLVYSGLGVHAEVWWRGFLQYSTDPQNVDYLELTED